jgi:hypothetical protein
MSVVPIPVQFDRITAKPLQTNEYFTTLVGAAAYAASPVGLIGQYVHVVTSNPSEPVETYQVQQDRTLVKVGSGSGDSMGFKWQVY